MRSFTKISVSSRKVLLTLLFAVIVLGGIILVNRWNILSKEATLDSNLITTPINIENNSTTLPNTIEGAVRASGGTYMVIDPKTGSSHDVADTIVDSGLTNSDKGAGNITLRSGIKISDYLPNRFTTKSYIVGNTKTEKGEVVVHTSDLPIFLTVYDDQGAILGTARDKNKNGDYVIQWNFEKGREYVSEVFINIGEPYDPNAVYNTKYTITYNSL